MRVGAAITTRMSVRFTLFAIVSNRFTVFVARRREQRNA
jgi:hypothetical protein